VSAAEFGGGAPSTEEEPDAVARGWAERAGVRDGALFVLARESLGVGRTDVAEPPEWFDLRGVTGLDALGDPVDGVLEVEMSMGDGRVVHAWWPETFCDRVVSTLQATLAAPSAPPPAPAPAAPPLFGPAPAAPAPAPAPVAAPAAPTPAPAAPAPPPARPSPPRTPAAPSSPPAPAAAPAPAPAAVTAPPELAAPAPRAPAAAPEPSPAAPAVPADMFAAPAAPAAVAAAADGLRPAGAERSRGTPPAGSTALVLEDVVYLGGYPQQPKKRKKCTATLTRDGVEVTGANGLSFRVPWDVVRTIETQNSDEARFRMNTKVHRDATALVLECDQDVTILLEARDCPTIPLRTAIAQLVADLRVVVV
jgi:hypothetical protein